MCFFFFELFQIFYVAYRTWNSETWNWTQPSWSTYTQYGATSTLSDGDSRKFYYCRCSSTFRKRVNDVWEVWTIGSYKINRACLLMLKVTIVITWYRNVCTKYWKMHCAHIPKKLDVFDWMMRQIVGKSH